MQFQGEALIPASRESVWQALNDPEILRECIPGCEEIQVIEENVLAAKVISKVGPIKARFGGQVTLSDIRAPHGYTISGEANGGMAGIIRGSARVELTEEEGRTRLIYDTDAQIVGKLAQIGARLIDIFVKKTADEFFGRLQSIVTERQQQDATHD